MLAYVDLAGFAFAAVAFLLSAVSLAVHYLKRNEHPLVAPLQSQIDSIQLTQADIIDRVEHWMKRDRVRKLREGQEAASSANIEPLNEPQSLPHAQGKEQLRQVARQKGFRV